ncbi:MAG: hypothetical protein QXP29_06980 [Candidatus Nezhaarchaeales archaeon]
MRIDVKTLCYVVFFIALALLTLSHFYVNPMLLYFSVLLVSCTYVVLLVQSRRVVDVIFITLVLPLYHSVFNSIIGPYDVLKWDVKAMENVASYILLKGRIPPANAPDPLLRLEYASYPSAFTLLAISSYVTSLTTEQLIRLPILTLPLCIIVIYVVITIFKRFRNYDGDLSRLLGILLIVNLILSLIPFIYQNFGRVLMLLTMMILFKLVTYNERQSIAISPTLLVIMLLSIALIMSHSESAVAFVIFVASLSISGFIFKSTAKYFYIGSVATIVVVVFMLHHLWLSQLFGESLLKMMLTTLSWIIQEEEALQAPLRYTPYDYSFTDMVLLSLGALSVISILAFNLLLVMKNVIKGKSRTPLMLFPVITAGLLFTVLFAFSPYKSDISLKFIYLLSAVIALFLYEKTIQHKVEAKQRTPMSRVIATLVIIALILSMAGTMVLRGTTRTYTINDIIQVRSLDYQLDVFSDIILLSLKDTTTLIIVDDPTLPYFIIRDYIAPRAYVRYIIIPVEPQELSYTITQINGIRLPRFVLFQQETAHRNIEGVYKLMVICSADGLKALEKNFTTTIILNTGTVAISIFTG